jgi:hypothetical protein
VKAQKQAPPVELSRLTVEELVHAVKDGRVSLLAAARELERRGYGRRVTSTPSRERPFWKEIPKPEAKP